MAKPSKDKSSKPAAKAVSPKKPAAKPAVSPGKAVKSAAPRKTSGPARVASDIATSKAVAGRRAAADFVKPSVKSSRTPNDRREPSSISGAKKPLAAPSATAKIKGSQSGAKSPAAVAAKASKITSRSAVEKTAGASVSRHAADATIPPMINKPRKQTKSKADAATTRKATTKNKASTSDHKKARGSENAGLAKQKKEIHPALEKRKQAPNKSPVVKEPAEPVAKEPAQQRRHEKVTTPARQNEEPISKASETPPVDETEKALSLKKTDLKRQLLEKKMSGKAKTGKPIAFSLTEALEIAHKRTPHEELTRKNGSNGQDKKTCKAAKKEPLTENLKKESRVLGAASVADILGFNPSSGKSDPNKDLGEIPAKFQHYYKLLVELRDHVLSELDVHTKETFKQSPKEGLANFPAYVHQVTDKDADSFDRDFALSLVSSEHEALYEIEEAINRIRKGSYGICEITGKPIKKERLLAVPFTRYSVEGQIEHEKNRRRPNSRGATLSDTGSEEGVQFLEEESEE